MDENIDMRMRGEAKRDRWDSLSILHRENDQERKTLTSTLSPVSASAIFSPRLFCSSISVLDMLCCDVHQRAGDREARLPQIRRRVYACV
jgi:hypothetical protein